MAKWQRKILLKPEWDRAADGELSMPQLAASIAAKLKALTPFKDEHIEEQREELVWQFESLAHDPDTSMPDINTLMSDLYDWGDARLDGEWNGKKVCWVDCLSPAPQESEANGSHNLIP